MHSTTHTLTPSQTAALAAFQAFLSSAQQVFILRGAAGTGKTTLVQEFLKCLDHRTRPYAMMAPTGRAAFIIGRITGRDASTIHRRIYALKSIKSSAAENESDDGLHTSFALKSNTDAASTVYIVDEASLISDAFAESEAMSFGSGKLLTDLFEFAHGRKIVFVGDYAQLPPVGMNFSPALDSDYIASSFACAVADHTLTQVVRQSSDSAVQANANLLRDSIDQSTFTDFHLAQAQDFHLERESLLIPYFDLSDTRPHPQSVIITHSNSQALEYNRAVRSHYFGDGAPRLRCDDLLMIARNCYAYEEELFNGNIVKVTACQSDEEVKARVVRVKMSAGRTESVELRFREATIAFASSEGQKQLSVTLLDNALDDTAPNIGPLLARALVVDFNSRLPARLKDSLSEIRRAMRSKQPLTPEQRELHASYLQLLAHDPYYNAVACKYGYAITCHKAQGGEWRNVFVDMSRYGGTANEAYFRWAYTALTRAQEQVWAFSAPEFSYLSRMVVEGIQLSSGLKVSTRGEGDNFCDARFRSIKAQCAQEGITATDGPSCAYQHRVTFHGPDGERARFSLVFNNRGYTGSVQKLESTSESFETSCRSIIEASLIPAEVPFEAPERPFAQRLVTFVKSQLAELGIGLLDITKEQYHDVFHLRTDGYAKMEFFYNATGFYTYLRMQSTLGASDAKLEALRQRFI